MNAGDLNQRITIQKKTLAPDSYNEMIETWADLATYCAEVKTTGSREVYNAQKLYSETTAVFRTHYTGRINSRMRIKYGNRIFAILGADDPDGRRVELMIAAKEAV